jgi:hypothetical protein
VSISHTAQQHAGVHRKRSSHFVSPDDRCLEMCALSDFVSPEMKTWRLHADARESQKLSSNTIHFESS